MSSVTGLIFLIFAKFSHLIFFLAGSVSFSLLLSISLSFLFLFVVVDVAVVGTTGLGVVSNPGIPLLFSVASCLATGLRSFEKSKVFRKSRFILDTSILGWSDGASKAGGEAGEVEEFSSWGGVGDFSLNGCNLKIIN